ncbi:tRNA adenosine(34) deaminase TadA [Clostridium cylindrosporum]|uniref:tRNA-specific adenosine deaminase n=1 Tax=Clostridium cylindrosporum DSM 605 TaxID=1121307 RepID=A0A0J8G4D9_CLOCY|nr:tRNA adenosine(34) deaminase TadA [Clostridium cylindrosporum]KMT22536.1 tRNA-specific adenosine deaminase TadA [Clostridium cylindrosporum DSM 605]
MESYFMSVAIEEAKKAASIGEVPVGAVVVKNGEIIAKAYNMKETLMDTTAHAEILAIKKASEILKGWRLIDCEIYITLEPCVMCAGAIVQSRLNKLIFGAYDRRFGACRSLYSIPDEGKLNHKVEVVEGIMERECSSLLSQFFKTRRNHT